jgi:hypothetical protein
VVAIVPVTVVPVIGGDSGESGDSAGSGSDKMTKTGVILSDVHTTLKFYKLCSV